MKILFVGECSYLHNTLKRGLEELGHKVLIVSDGNGWHNSPRDIDLRRPERWGKLVCQQDLYWLRMCSAIR